MKENLKATKQQADQLEAIQAELEKFKDCVDVYSESKYLELLQKREDLKANYDWTDEVFEENGKKGLKNIKGEVVVPAIYDDFGPLESYSYYCNLSSVVAKFGDYMALVKRDGTGTPITEFEYHYIEPICFLPIYAVWKKNDLKHFALMIDGEVITPYEIEKYYMQCNGVLPLEANGKAGMLAYDLGLIYIKPEYDELYDDGFGSDFTFVKDGKKGRVTLDKRFISDEEYNSLSEEEQDNLEDVGFICSYDI